MNHPQDLYQEVRAGGDIKSFLLALHRRNTGELPVLSPDTEKIEAIERVDELPTVTTLAVPTFSIASIIPHRFYAENGYQVLKLDHLTVETIDLVSEAVRRYRRATGYYPEEIIPCPSRFVLLTFGHFSPTNGILIPFSRDFVFPIDYDVLVRGRLHG
jgi:hypothetical protein